MSTSKAAFLLQLYQSYRLELYRYARRLTRSEEADDLVQESFLRLLERDQVEALQHPRPFLFRTLTNLATDTIRKVNVRSRYIDFDVDPDSVPSAVTPTASDLDSTHELKQFRAALNEVPASHRDAFLLSRIDGLSYKEIAQRLGVSSRSVERYVMRTLEHLRQRLER